MPEVRDYFIRLRRLRETNFDSLAESIHEWERDVSSDEIREFEKRRAANRAGAQASAPET